MRHIALSTVTDGRAVISDGEQFATALITTDSAVLVTSNEVKVNDLVILKQYAVNAVGSAGKVCIIMSMAAAQPSATDDAPRAKIGEPIAWNTPEVSATTEREPSPSAAGCST